MKLKYIGDINLSSSSISFSPNSEPYIVSDEVGKYLLSTFTSLFEEIKEVKPKEEKKEEIKETEGKVQKPTKAK